MKESINNTSPAEQSPWAMRALAVPMTPTTTKTAPTAQEQIQILPLNMLATFEGHPFKVIQDDNFQKLVESVKENGVLIPAVARPKGDSYELISGHRRKAACQTLGLEVMPVIVREMTNEQAVVSMVDSNVQRENILPSEKAFAYKMKWDAIKKQGKRTDLTSTQVGQKSWSVNQVAEKVGDSRNQIQRYIRLAELIPQLLNLVDDKLIALNPAVEISYLPKKEQEELLSTMQSEDRTPSLSQCQRMRKLSAEGRLDMDAIFTVMTEEKGNQKEQVKFGIDDLRQFFPKDYDPQRMQQTIIKLLEEWQRKRQRQREEQSRDAR